MIEIIGPTVSPFVGKILAAAGYKRLAYTHGAGEYTGAEEVQSGDQEGADRPFRWSGGLRLDGDSAPLRPRAPLSSPLVRRRQYRRAAADARRLERRVALVVHEGVPLASEERAPHDCAEFSVRAGSGPPVRKAPPATVGRAPGQGAGNGPLALRPVDRGVGESAR